MHSFLYPHPPSSLSPEGPDTLHIRPDPSIGITEIRRIQTFLSRRPLSSPHSTAVIHSAHLLTLPAQHALLKTLEEPPGDSQIILITPAPDSLLPTILSRVQIAHSTVIPLVKRGGNAADAAEGSLSSLITPLLSAKGVGDRLKILADSVTTRDQLSDLLDSLETYLHYHLDSGLDYQLIADTRKYLKANCNLKLLLTHLAANLHLDT